MDAEDKNKSQMTTIQENINKEIEKVAAKEGRRDLKGLQQIFPYVDQVFKDLTDAKGDQVVFPHFFPMLWNNSFNPPDPRYGLLCQQLKSALTTALASRKNIKFGPLDLTMFTEKLKNLWEAIKKETFVFKFQNIQAMNAFISMRDVYISKVGDLRLEFFEKAKFNLEKCCNLKTKTKEEVIAEYENGEATV